MTVEIRAVQRGDKDVIVELVGELAEWMVLDWNEAATALYRSRGARLMEAWTLCRVDGAELRALGR